MQHKLSLPAERSLGNQVRRCHRMFDRLLTARLSAHGLNCGFWYYLRALWAKDGLTQKELSDITNVAENTTVTMINLMMKSGLVERARDANDRRKLRITLTPLGRKLQAELMHHAFEINSIAATGIPRDEIDTCLSVLSRMAENLQNELLRCSGTNAVTARRTARLRPAPRRPRAGQRARTS